MSRVTVHGFETWNWGEIKRVYELDVYKLAEELSDMVWQDFDKWNKSNFSKLMVKRLNLPAESSGHFFQSGQLFESV